MKKTTEQCYLGHHVSKGGYVLLPFAAHYMVEPFSNISQEDMNSNGLSMVLNYLRNPPADAKRVSMFDEETKKRLLKIKRDHVLITLVLYRAIGSVSVIEELEFFPMHATRGFNFEKRADEKRVVPLPLSNEQFLEHLRVAFDVAS